MPLAVAGISAGILIVRAQETVGNTNGGNEATQRSSAMEVEVTRMLTGSGIVFQKDFLLPRRYPGSGIATIRIESPSDGREFSESAIRNATVALTNSRAGKGPVSRQRTFELSEDSVVAFAVDREKRVLWWEIQPDPRIVRSENADASGALAGKTIYRPIADLDMFVPADGSIEALHLFKPAWDGSVFSLEPLGEVYVR